MEKTMKGPTASNRALKKWTGCAFAILGILIVVNVFSVRREIDRPYLNGKPSITVSNNTYLWSASVINPTGLDCMIEVISSSSGILEQEDLLPRDVVTLGLALTNVEDAKGFIIKGRFEQEGSPLDVMSFLERLGVKEKRSASFMTNAEAFVVTNRESQLK